jgi:hypothetical protein
VHVFNRILVILGLLTVMVVSAIAFVAWGPFLQIIIAFLQQADAAVVALSGLNPVLRWAGGFVFTALVWAICVALLWLEVRRPRIKTIMVQQVSGGQAELTADSIVSRLEYNLDQLPEVIRARPRVRTARKGVRIDLAVETSPEVEVPSKSEEIQQVTRDIIENQMGLKLESMRVVMRHAPYPKSFFKGHKPETGAPPRPAVRAQVSQPPYVAPLLVPTTPSESQPRPSLTPTPHVAAPEGKDGGHDRVAETVAPPPSGTASLESRPADEAARPAWRPWSFLRPGATGDRAGTTTADTGVPADEAAPPTTETIAHDQSADTDIQPGPSDDDQAEDKNLFT